MNTFKLESTSHHPKVILDAESGVFEISGRSLPEQVLKLYDPILEWIKEYTLIPHDKTVIKISLDYINSSSTKYLLEILKRLNSYFKEGNNVVVKWYYDEYDEDCEESGEEYADLLDLNFEVIQKD